MASKELGPGGDQGPDPHLQHQVIRYKRAYHAFGTLREFLDREAPKVQSLDELNRHIAGVGEAVNTVITAQLENDDTPLGMITRTTRVGERFDVKVFAFTSETGSTIVRILGDNQSEEEAISMPYYIGIPKGEISAVPGNLTKDADGLVEHVTQPNNPNQQQRYFGLLTTAVQDLVNVLENPRPLKY